MRKNWDPCSALGRMLRSKSQTLLSHTFSSKHKNRKDSSLGRIKDCLRKCIPIVSKDQNHQIPNLVTHNPSNPFVSILMELGCVRDGEYRVQVVNTTDYDAFRKQESAFTQKKADFIHKSSSTAEQSLRKSEKLKRRKGC